VLTGEQSPLPVAIVSIAVVRRTAENGDLAGIFKPSQDAIVRDVAEQEITPVAEPHWPFSPARARVQALDGSVPDRVFGTARIDNFHSGVGIDDRRFPILLRGQDKWFACQGGRCPGSDAEECASSHGDSPATRILTEAMYHFSRGVGAYFD